MKNETQKAFIRLRRPATAWETRRELRLHDDDPVPVETSTPDTMGIAAASAGTLLLVGRFWDAFFDPMMGIMADRTNTRWGKFRPWVLWTALPWPIVMVPGVHGAGLELRPHAGLRRCDQHPADDALLGQQHALLGNDRGHDRRRQ